ncbi:hypothetical protein BDQ17DRAFT_1537902 [Cyathus striatus]|nr:hypothetical protein BDQ17DRAFT_1537902 [Cyathus striatus]
MASPKHHEYFCSLGATHTFDYNSSALTEDVAAAIGGDGKIPATGKLAILLPIKEGNNISGGLDENLHVEIPDNLNPFPKTINFALDLVLKEKLMPKILPELLASGAIQPNRVRLLDQGSFKDRVGSDLNFSGITRPAAKRLLSN